MCPAVSNKCLRQMSVSYKWLFQASVSDKILKFCQANVCVCFRRQKEARQTDACVRQIYASAKIWFCLKQTVYKSKTDWERVIINFSPPFLSLLLIWMHFWSFSPEFHEKVAIWYLMWPKTRYQSLNINSTDREFAGLVMNTRNALYNKTRHTNNKNEKRKCRKSKILRKKNRKHFDKELPKIENNIASNNTSQAYNVVKNLRHEYQSKTTLCKTKAEKSSGTKVRVVRFISWNSSAPQKQFNHQTWTNSSTIQTQLNHEN